MSEERKFSALYSILIERDSDELHLAAWHDLERLRMLLDAGANTKIQNREGLTALHCALVWKRMDAVKVLLDHDSKIDLQDRLGRTPLHIAAAQGEIDIVRRLLDAGVNTSLQEIEGHTPLHLALMYEKYQTAEILVNSDSVVNLPDSQGNTPLHWAAYCGEATIVRKLLDAGADARLQNGFGSTPLHAAARFQRRDAALVLADHGGEIDLPDSFFRKTPLHYAACHGMVGVVRKLLDAGANTRLQNIDGDTPLHCALSMKMAYAARILVNFDCRNDLQNGYGRSPLHLAADRGYVGIVRKLLDAGANIRLQDIFGWTPICMAKPGAAKVLLESDGENDLQGLWGESLLNFVVARNDARSVKLRLFCDVHPHTKNCNGVFPLSVSTADTDKLIVSAIALRDITIDWEVLDLHPDKTRNCMTFLAQCRAEVQRMKETKVNETNVSYYDLATSSVSKVAIYLQNGDIRWHWSDGVPHFHNYGELIAFKVKRAEKRRNLSAQCLAYFSFLSENLTFLPKTSMGIILQHLNQRDMQNFVESFRDKAAKQFSRPGGKK
ncbi:serine/threonine-protein phosphatase 6 regulatory ankyrin repeat subunit C-like [Uloborus diversus]|uniref:serine/threonine-protein phosphatase 6 regulatory ankyrin repeat subunit C-like n=1 Tax=Uloborus diversus TaxID=327109 RepID=UPI002409C1C7|nr:serine/threonine-protein phosphatase 6 regulatory ankyrin repeat subunit C-like [Uloborus diversus]